MSALDDGSLTLDEQNPNLVVEIDLDRGLHHANPAARRELGELLDAGADRSPFRPAAEEACRPGAPDVLSRELVLEGRVYQCKVCRVAGTRRVRIYAVDVSERAAAERRLRLSETRYRALVEHAGDAFFLHDLEGRIVDVNQRAVESLGYSRDQLLGMNIHDIDRTSSRDQIPWSSVRAEPVTMTGVHVRRDGSTFPVEVRIGRVTLEGCDLMLALARDVSERRLAEAERENLEAELQQARRLESLGRLAGGVAHDFNNLLFVILNYASLITEQVGEHASLAPKVKRLRDAAERASTLTRQLLTFSRRQVGQPTIVDVGEVIEDLNHLLARTLGEDVEMRTDLGSELANVVIGRPQLEQVILNLTLNARDALPSGGTISIEARNVDLDAAYVSTRVNLQAGRHVRIVVSDDGLGMDEEVRARVFEPFFTTKGPGAGTGLGLSTVYGIVTSAGGHVEVDSAVGEGTTVMVHLPASEADVVALSGREPSRGLTAARSATILVVEDEEEVRELLVDLLSTMGYEVLAARDANDALDSYAEEIEDVDLLLTDVVMPGMSGFELAEKLVALAPDLGVVFMTGHADEMLGRHLPRDHEATFLEKPFTRAKLHRTLTDILEAAERSAPVPRSR